jgi:MFS family permease
LAGRACFDFACRAGYARLERSTVLASIQVQMTSPTQSRNSDSLRAHPSYVRYWFARVCSGFAFQMLSVAAGWQVYDLTHRALDLGLIGLVQFIPSLLLVLPAGHVADHFDRRRIVLACVIVECVAIAILAIASARSSFGEAAILATLFAIGVARAVGFPTAMALAPALVPAALFPRAAAAGAAAAQTAMIVGPALGGFIYVAGAHVVYGVAAVLYLGAAILVSTIRYERPPVPREPPSLRTLFAGAAFMRRQPVVLGAISLDLFAVLLGGATALLPIFARDILHTGPWGLGLLRAAPAAGALTISLWLTRHAVERRVGPVMFGSVAGFGVATLVFALSTSFTLSLVALAALGALDMVSMVIRGALVQLETPDAMRGRVSAINAIFINTSNQLGEFESGVTAAWFGTVPSVLIGGIGTLVVVGLWMWWFPALRKRDYMQSPAGPPESAPARSL